eukprot:4232695-Prorocentrum_lima.AAC.1
MGYIAKTTKRIAYLSPELGHLVPYLLVRVHRAYWMDGNGQRHPLQMATGVHQGCPFSMGLFSVIIGTLADYVARRFPAPLSR